MKPMKNQSIKGVVIKLNLPNGQVAERWFKTQDEADAEIRRLSKLMGIDIESCNKKVEWIETPEKKDSH